MGSFEEWNLKYFILSQSVGNHHKMAFLDEYQGTIGIKKVIEYVNVFDKKDVCWTNLLSLLKDILLNIKVQ